MFVKSLLLALMIGRTREGWRCPGPGAGRSRGGVLVDEADDAVAAKGQVAAKALADADAGMEQAPGDGDEGDAAALGAGDAADEIAKGPGMGIGQGDGLTGERIETPEGGVGDEVGQGFFGDEILRSRAVANEGNESGAADLAADGPEDSAGRGAVDEAGRRMMPLMAATADSTSSLDVP